MLYKAYEIQRSLLNAGSAMAAMAADVLNDPRYPFAGNAASQAMASALDVFAHAAAPRGKPAFGIKTVQVDGNAHAVVETTAKAYSPRYRSTVTRCRSSFSLEPSN